MSYSYGIPDDLKAEYTKIADATGQAYGNIFREALDLALPLMRQRYAECTSCGTIPRKGAKFCDQCGHAVGVTVTRQENTHIEKPPTPFLV